MTSKFELFQELSIEKMFRKLTSAVEYGNEDVDKILIKDSSHFKTCHNIIKSIRIQPILRSCMQRVKEFDLWVSKWHGKQFKT